MRLTSSRFSGRTSSTRPCISRSKPSRIPRTSTPCSSARMVAALMTLLIPGAGPPPTKMASFSLDTCFSFSTDGSFGADTARTLTQWPRDARRSGASDVNPVTRSLAGCGRGWPGGVDDLDLPGDLRAHPLDLLDVEALAQELGGGRQAGQAHADGGVEADVGVDVIEERSE